MRNWQLQEAKAKLSQMVQKTLSQGPQRITIHGKPAVVIVSCREYDQLTKPNLPFGKFMQQSPLAGISLNLERDPSKNRNDIKL